MSLPPQSVWNDACRMLALTEDVNNGCPSILVSSTDAAEVNLKDAVTVPLIWADIASRGYLGSSMRSTHDMFETIGVCARDEVEHSKQTGSKTVGESIFDYL